MSEKSTAMQTAALLASGAVTAEALAENTLRAIETCGDPAIFTILTPERAMASAKASKLRHAAGRPRGLLDGVPVAWKDLFDLDGMVTTVGSRMFDDAAPASADAIIVKRLEAAGMVSVGRVNMSEFAYSGLGLNPHFGTPVNAAGHGRAPGGSSSGSAVAVGRGLVPIAIGSDTGGSVRIPAAFNGTIGYKTSFGRWPMGGVFPLSRTLDTLGVFCHTMADAILVDAAALGQAVPQIGGVAIEDLRIVVPTTLVLDDCHPAVLDNFEAAIGRLAKAGARIERLPFPAFETIVALNARHGPIPSAEAYAMHKERAEGPLAARIDQRIVRRLLLAAPMTMVDYIAIRHAREKLIEETAHWFETPCLFAFPTIPHTAPPIAALEADDDLFVRTNAKTLRNTQVGNFLDWCGVSIPNGADADGMPTAFLLSGGPRRDAHLLGAAYAAEPFIRGDA